MPLDDAIQRAEPVERRHQLEEVGAEEDVVPHGVLVARHQEGAVQGDAEEADVDDDALEEVEQGEAGRALPFHH